MRALSIKTDLAKEIIDKKSLFYANFRKFISEKTEITEIKIKTDGEEALIGKPKGTYITLESDFIKTQGADFFSEVKALSQEIKKLLPEKGNILLVGVGNPFLTADSLGYETARLTPSVKLGNRVLTALIPGVKGKSGVSPKVFIRAAIEELFPAAVIIVDALAAESIANIGRTVQLSTAGIAPGSGAKASSVSLNSESLGVFTLALGVPTVICEKDEDLFVSVGNIDFITERAAKLLSYSVTLAAFPGLSLEELTGIL